MEANITLTKGCNNAALHQYFGAIYQLAASGKEFPINLDSVWHLVYSEKGKAVRALKENFYESIDFVSLAQNGKRKNGGQNKVEYYLSISCMEFFIARKVREVFEVYRQVFHRVMAGAAGGDAEQVRTLTEAVSRAEETIRKQRSELRTAKAMVTKMRHKVEAMEKQVQQRQLPEVKTQSTTQFARLFSGFYTPCEIIETLVQKGILARVGRNLRLTPAYEGQGLAIYKQLLFNGRAVEYIGWTPKGVSMLIRELNIF